MNAVATIDAPRQSLIATMASRYSMEPKAFADTLRATVVPKNATNEEFAAFLMVAREYDLNPITKEIYAFPKQGGGIQPIVSVDGWANLINSHPQCDGIEFEDHLDGSGNLVSITCRIYRKDRARPTTATEYMVECRRETATWKQWPRRMLRHKALIQAARYAFGFAGIVDPDEGERTAAPTPPSSEPKLIPPSPPAPTRGETLARTAATSPQRPNMQDEPPTSPAPERLDAQGSVDPEAWTADCERRMSACKTLDALNELWEHEIALESEDAFPADIARVRESFAKHEARLSDG
ncbi:RecT family recombinase [Hansschlegelia plantiphila]|uniref:Phage recombination protein Bet n=1 Tax=Hansschlegelia plantiphila TaxID=374655 RepID=A0A9W6MWU4_9HYPH|nr:recombinase RecT [Hansschlegelia plantiphila]GLK69220.1 hypothetical protein GCM10008179_28580 [Hansschlegelia plantiphila]